MTNKINKIKGNNKILVDHALWKGFLYSLGLLYSTALISDNPITNLTNIEQPKQITPNTLSTSTGRQSWRQIQ